MLHELTACGCDEFPPPPSYLQKSKSSDVFAQGTFTCDFKPDFLLPWFSGKTGTLATKLSKSN